MAKSPRKNVPDVGIKLEASCMPSELASDRATTPGQVVVPAAKIRMKSTARIISQ